MVRGNRRSADELRAPSALEEHGAISAGLELLMCCSSDVGLNWTNSTLATIELLVESLATLGPKVCPLPRRSVNDRARPSVLKSLDTLKIEGVLWMVFHARTAASKPRSEYKQLKTTKAISDFFWNSGCEGPVLADLVPECWSRRRCPF